MLTMPVPVTATTLLPLNLLACHSQEGLAPQHVLSGRHMFSSLIFMSFLLKRLLLITCRVDGEEAHAFKGTVSRDFRLLVFFMDQFPPSI